VWLQFFESARVKSQVARGGSTSADDDRQKAEEGSTQQGLVGAKRIASTDNLKTMLRYAFACFITAFAFFLLKPANQPTNVALHQPWKPRASTFPAAVDDEGNDEVIRYDLVQDSLGRPGGPVYKPIFRKDLEADNVNHHDHQQK